MSHECTKRLNLQDKSDSPEDDRFADGEQRFLTLGLLEGVRVSIVHTESADEIHVISFRNATPNEIAILFANM